MVSDPGPAREDQVRSLLLRVQRWASGERGVDAVALVGSWARAEATDTSDVDLVVLTDDPARYLGADDWIVAAVGQPAPCVRRHEWGPLTEVRVRLTSGLEVELGFADSAWAAIDPIDPGTAAVVRGGCRPLHDPDGRLAALVALVGIGSIPPP